MDFPNRAGAQLPRAGIARKRGLGFSPRTGRASLL